MCHYPDQVRERSARSVPMGKTSMGRSSISATSDSLSDNEGSFSRGPPTRKSSAPLRSSLTPGNFNYHAYSVTQAKQFFCKPKIKHFLRRWEFAWQQKQQQTSK